MIREIRQLRDRLYKQNNDYREAEILWNPKAVDRYIADLDYILRGAREREIKRIGNRLTEAQKVAYLLKNNNG